MYLKECLCAAAVTLAAASSAGTTYYVNGTSGNDTNAGTSAAPFKTIHRGLAVAQDGDRIEVAAGTYTLSTDYPALVVTNAVELVGTGTDRADVKVYCAGSASGWTGFGGMRLICVSNALAKVKHISFEGPKYLYNRPGNINGSQAYVYAGTLSDCVFRDTYVDAAAGCGVYLDSADAVVEDSLILNHYCVNYFTGGVGLTINNGLARRCEITGNISRQNGPVGLVGATARLFDSVVTNNQSCAVNPMWKNSTFGAGYGPGVLIRNAGAIVSNCLIAANRANQPSGGTKTYCKGGGITFEKAGKVYNTIIRDNYSYLEGGGVYGSGYLYNCAISGNVSESGTGGGVCGQAYLYNCTVTGNDSLLDGGVDGIDGTGSSAKATVENSIVFGNGTTDTGANVTLTSSWTDDPKFRDAAAGDYQLAADSPCIDADITAAAGLPTLDAGGRARVSNGKLDYGAYEAQMNFRVIGDPETFGVPATPAFGDNYGTAVGTVQASVTSPYADTSGLTNVVCTGYTYVARDTANVVTTNTGAATAYDAPFARMGDLTWHLSTKYVQTASTRGNGAGTVTGAGLYDKDADFTLTATPAAGDHFWRWEGDVGEADPFSPSITLTADFARRVTAVFGRDWYVSTAGDDEADGRTLATAKLTPSKLVPQAGDGDNVYFAAGTYQLPAGSELYDFTTLTLTNAVRLAGLGTSRSDVTVKSLSWNWAGRPLRVANTYARVENMRFWGIEDLWGNPQGEGKNPQGQCALIESGTVSNCVFYGSTLGGASAGVVLKNADALAVDCEIRDHYTANGSDEAGGLAIYNGLALRCLICDNNERSSAGGVSLNGSGARLIDCVVTNNGAFVPSPRGLYYPDNTWGPDANRGGGVAVLSAGAIVSNCVIAGNKVALPGNHVSDTNKYLQGGGIMFKGAGKVYNTVISGNRAFNEGGAVSAASGIQPELYNCLIVGNSTSNKTAGAVYGQAKLYNCTIADNWTDLDGGVGGVVGLAADKQTTLVNSIVWDNTAKGTLANWTDAAMTYSCSTPLADGTGNIAADPQFRNSRKRGRCVFRSDSPCAEAGLWHSWMPGFKYLNGVDMPAEEASVPMGCNAPYPLQGLAIIVK